MWAMDDKFQFLDFHHMDVLDLYLSSHLDFFRRAIESEGDFKMTTKWTLQETWTLQGPIKLYEPLLLLLTSWWLVWFGSWELSQRAFLGPFFRFWSMSVVTKFDVVGRAQIDTSTWSSSLLTITSVHSLDCPAVDIKLNFEPRNVSYVLNNATWNCFRSESKEKKEKNVFRELFDFSDQFSGVGQKD